jgi:outer membrane protein assembly factor BamB
VIGALLGALLAQAADWPGFMGPARDGKSQERGLPERWGPEGPRVLWSRPLGESFGACSVAQGRVLHFDRFGDRARLTCLRSRTGEDLWTFEYPTAYTDRFSDNHGPRTVPVIDGERVFVFGVEGTLAAVGLADGKLLWKRDTAAEFGVVPNFFGVGSTPVVEGDLLIAAIGGSPPASPPITSGELTGNGSGIVAFDKATGEVRYKITDELASYASPVVATIGGRRWGFVFARGGLVGFEPATGKVDFHHPWRARMINSVNVSTPVVAGDRVFVSEAYGMGGALLKVRPGGAEVVWSDGRRRDQALATWWTTALHVDGFLYGSHGGQGEEPELRCVELETGKVRWSRGGLSACSLLFVDGRFVALSERGVLRLLKATPERYEELSAATLKSKEGGELVRFPARAAPVLSHGLLYVRGKDRLVCVELIP